MPNWHVVLRGPTARLAHTAEDDTGGIWRGEIEVWRGAPSWEEHPEILHAILGVQTAGGYPHGRFILHTWTLDIPERYEGLWNCGDDRRYVVMRASGGFRNWTLVLKIPLRTPDFVLQALQAGFHASVPVPVVEVASPAPRPARQRARKVSPPKPPRQPAPPAQPLTRAARAAVNL